MLPGQFVEGHNLSSEDMSCDKKSFNPNTYIGCFLDALASLDFTLVSE